MIPKTIIIAIVGSIVLLLVSAVTGVITGALSGMHILVGTTVSVIINLGIFLFAMNMNKKFTIKNDLIPILIAAPLAIAILGAVGITLEVISGPLQIGAGLGMVIASFILADSLVKMTGIKFLK